MFETLYRYSRVLVRHLEGPAAEERDRFVTHCVEAGAARESVLHLASELLLVAQRLDIDGIRAVTPEEIGSAADRWVRHQRRHGRIRTARFSRQRFVQVASDWLRFLGRLEAAPVTRGAGAELVLQQASLRFERFAFGVEGADHA
jgi:integrase/recombinase XerD